MPVTVDEDPGQFGHLRHVRLAEEGGLRRVEAERQVVEGHVADVLGEDLAGGSCDERSCSSQPRRLRFSSASWSVVRAW